MIFYILVYMLLLGMSLGQLVFLLNRTDFLYEYSRKLGFSKLLKLEEYQDWRAKLSQKDEKYHYPTFYREKHDTFMGRLVGCPYCLITLLSFIFTLAIPIFSLPVASGGCFVFLILDNLYRINN